MPVFNKVFKKTLYKKTNFKLLCFVIFITICTFPLQTGLKSIKWSYEGFLPKTP